MRIGNPKTLQGILPESSILFKTFPELVELEEFSHSLERILILEIW